MIKTRLTEKLDLKHPIIQAPMAFAAGGKLASAVTRAGGLGLIGGGYGDADWLKQEFIEVGNTSVGCGFITWSLAKNPELLISVLDHKPASIFLSFGDPAPFVSEIKNEDIPLICQIQTLKDAKYAIDVGADIVVAQGSEAGGHGEKRATLTLVPEVVDYARVHAPEVLVCAAGGIGDGRGLAATLMLGADGILMGSRFWASAEAMVHQNMIQAALKATGDDTIRSSVMDIARSKAWPKRYTARVLQNSFTDQWHGDETTLRNQIATEQPRWEKAWQEGNIDIANTFVGEVAGLLSDVKSAEEIIDDIVQEAEELLTKASGMIG